MYEKPSVLPENEDEFLKEVSDLADKATTYAKFKDYVINSDFRNIVLYLVHKKGFKGLREFYKASRK